MGRLLRQLVLLAALVYGGLCAYLYFAQDTLLYYPSAEVTSDDADALYVENDGETLKVWTLGDGRNALLYFGGNGESVVRNASRFANRFDDTRIYLLDYRGYGGSSGEPDETGFYRDAAFLFDYAAARHQRVSVIGRSLGSGVATWLATERPVERLVLVTPYDSIEAVAQAAYPIAPVSLMLRDKYRAIDIAGEVEAPTLILMAEQDVVIPREHSERLADALGSRRLATRTLAGTSHNSIASSPEYVAAMSQFFGSVAESDSVNSAR